MSTTPTWQVCAACGSEIPETDPHPRCPRCGGLLEVRHQAPGQGGQALRATFDARRGVWRGPLASGVWRFREAVLPTAGEHLLTYPEGNTPLLESAPVARWAGSRGLLLKHEGQNPTGSFKDRGMTVGVTQARRIGARAVSCASTGNTAASLAAYAALAGLPALVLVPKDQVAAGKLAQALAYGARTLLVRGNFDDCLELADEASERLGVYLLNSVNPFRLEGQKTIVLELLQQLLWDPPDWIVVPAGNLGNTAAFGKALEEARAWGVIDRVPRLAAVQAEGAAPFALGFRSGFARRDGDQYRQPRFVRPRGALDSRDERRGDRRQRRRHSRGQSGGGRRGNRMRARQRCFRGRRAAIGERRCDREGRSRGRGADRPRPQGPGNRGPLPSRGRAAAGACQPADRDRREPRGGRTRDAGLTRPPPPRPPAPPPPLSGSPAAPRPAPPARRRP